MKYQTNKFSPLNAPTRIDVQSLIDDVMNLHFKYDTLQAEESDIGIRLKDYAFYDLKLININQVSDVDSIEYAPVDINEDNVEDNIHQILSTKTYPPIVLDAMDHIVDGYHRVFALKKIGCRQVWAYIPDKNTYSDPNEAIVLTKEKKNGVTMRGKSMKLNELLSVAGRGYPDAGAYLDAASGNDYCDDTLALFVVRELKDTFDHNAPMEAQLNEAIRAMRVAKDDLDGVIETLQDRLCEVKNDNTRDG